MSTTHWADQNALALFLAALRANDLSDKVDKETGKGLSSNDYTTAEKDKLAAIEAQANKTTIIDNLTSDATTSALSAAQGKELKALIDAIDTEISDLDSGDMKKSTYDQDSDGVVDNSKQLDGHASSYFATAASLADKLDTDGNGSSVTATFTSASDRANINSNETLAVIFAKLAKWYVDLANVAWSGSYSDLSNKPEIPTVTNDLTDALKANYDAAYTYSIATHAPVEAEENVIETVQVNGTAQTVSNKIVNITVPTTVSALSDASNYALKTDLTNVYTYKGSVADEASLPASGNTAGDVYNTEDTGMNFAWTGTAWDALGTASVEVEALTAAEIDAIFTA